MTTANNSRTFQTSGNDRLPTLQAARAWLAHVSYRLVSADHEWQTEVAHFVSAHLTRLRARGCRAR